MAKQLRADELELCARVGAECACNQVRRASRAITQRYERALAPSGLKVTQLPILVALGWKGPLPITLLADVLGLDRTTLTRNLKVLEQRGLLVVVEDADDARVRLAQITDTGVEVLSDALALWRGVHEAVATEFGEPRLGSLLGELSTLSAAMEG